MNSTVKTHHNTKTTQVVVLGGGPGGYSAAFRCADLGIQTTIIERYPNLGGVCLNVGCIPSKTLLNIAKIIEDSKILNKQEIIHQKITFNINRIRERKEKIIYQLSENLNNMAKTRHVEIINGYGTFIDPNNIKVKTDNNRHITITFKYAIIAAGSHSATLPFVPYTDHRVWNSTDALALKSIPKQLLIIGAGAIGLEMATIYHSFGSEVDIVELLDRPISNIDQDITKLFLQYTKEKFRVILETKITAIDSKIDGLYVSTENKKSIKNVKRYDAILVSVGRLPNGKLLNADQIINIDEFGFIRVNNQMRTNTPNIFAIGDIIGTSMLAHKSIHEGHVAAEVIAGMKSYFDPKVIPAVIYTNPEVAWVGYTEKTAIEHNIDYETASFPWFASERAITADAEQGVTKLIFNKKTHRIIGGTVLGKNASELLGEIGLAIEMGCDAEDITLTIHPHPTLNETIQLSSSMYQGSITDLPNTKLKINKKI